MKQGADQPDARLSCSCALHRRSRRGAMRKLGLSTIALVTFAGSAVMAADLPPPAAPVYRPPPVVVPAFSWTGTSAGLLYVKGGGAWMKDNFALGLTPAGAAFLGGLGVAAAPGTVASVGFNSSGWTAGAGFEWAFNDRVSVFAEYDYLSFGT